MVEISVEQLSEIIGAIYDCAVAPEKWPAVLKTIVDTLNFDNAALTIHDMTSANAQAVITVGIDDDWAAAAPRYSIAIAELWGGPSVLPTFPLEEPIVQSEATPRATWQGNAYFEDVLKPRGLHDAMAIALVRDSRTLGVLAFGRHQLQGEFDETSKAAMRLFAPHLRRAVVIGRLLEEKTAAASTFSDVIDAMTAGVVLVDENMGIVHANKTGDRMLRDGDPVERRNGRLATRNSLTQKVLSDAVAQAARSEVLIERRSIDIPAQRLDGTPTVIQVLPMRRRKLRESVSQRTAAAVFIANSADPPRLPADAVAMMYDLTPAETRVFELIVAGKTPIEIAQQLRVALPTVKSHLSRVFEKTGSGRQADLVSIAARMTLTV